MLATEHTQSLEEFRSNIDQTIDRVKQTGEAEILTVDGQPRAVVVSVEAYEQMAREARLSRDVANIQRALADIEEGRVLEVEACFQQIHARLLAFAEEQNNGASK